MATPIISEAGLSVHEALRVLNVRATQDLSDAPDAANREIQSIEREESQAFLDSHWEVSENSIWRTRATYPMSFQEIVQNANLNPMERASGEFAGAIVLIEAARSTQAAVLVRLCSLFLAALRSY